MPSWDLHHREAGEKREQPEPVCSTDTDISGAGLDQARQELLYQGEAVNEKFKQGHIDIAMQSISFNKTPYRKSI